MDATDCFTFPVTRPVINGPTGIKQGNGEQRHSVPHTHSE